MRNVIHGRAGEERRCTRQPAGAGALPRPARSRRGLSLMTKPGAGTLRELYERQIIERGFRTDPAQLAIVSRLEALRGRLIARASVPRLPRRAACCASLAARSAPAARAGVLPVGTGGPRQDLADGPFLPEPSVSAAPPAPLPPLHVRHSCELKDLQQRRGAARDRSRAPGRRGPGALLR